MNRIPSTMNAPRKQQRRLSGWDYSQSSSEIKLHKYTLNMWGVGRAPAPFFRSCSGLWCLAQGHRDAGGYDSSLEGVSTGTVTYKQASSVRVCVFCDELTFPGCVYSSRG